MATMEAAAVAATTTDVAQPMDEQAGPFPVEKLQVRRDEDLGGRARRRRGEHAHAQGEGPPPGRPFRPPAPPFPPSTAEDEPLPTYLGRHNLVQGEAWSDF